MQLKPAMGWNSWNTFTNMVDENLILETAEALIKSGLKDCGYDYVVLDDCWSLKERDKDGRLVPNPEKFPHGMKYLADKIHSMGLKFGMYSCAGSITCAGYPGSYEHEMIDAKTFAEWGVDFLKYDYCFHSIGTPGHLLYKRMSLALATCGRDILFNACSWGADDTRIWIKETGADSFRSTPDINDSWVSIKSIAQSQLKVLEYNGQGCFNDMDMLVVGLNNGGRVGGSGCSENEYFLHFALWSMLGSPLMIGCDIRKMTEETYKILSNKELIRINQDKKYRQAFFLNQKLEKNGQLSLDNPYYYSNYPIDMPVLARFLDDGTIAIGMFNFTDGATTYFHSQFSTESVGLPESTGKTLLLKNVLDGEEFVVKNGNFNTSVPAHSAKVYIARIIDK